MLRRKLAWIVGMILLGALCVAFFWPREPRVNGKPISYWAEVAGPYDGKYTSEEQAAAVKVLRNHGTNTLPWLLSEMRFTNSAFRTWLADLVEKQDIIKIRFQSEDERHDRAVRVFEVLGGIATPAVPDLLLLSEQIEENHCEEAIERIGPEAVPSLVEALCSTNAEVRIIAARALGSFGTNAAIAVDQLLICLRETPEIIHEVYAYALGEIQADPNRVIPALTKLLHSPHENVRVAAAQAIGNYGPRAEAAFDELAELAAGNTRPWDTVLTALLRVGSKQEVMVPILIRRLPDAGCITRCFIAQSLGDFPNFRSVSGPALLKTAQDEDELVARSALISLGRIQLDSSVVVPLLIAKLGDERPGVRAAAAYALGEFGPAAETAVPGLTGLLNDKAFGAGSFEAHRYHYAQIGEIAKASLLKIRSSSKERVE